MRKILFLLSAAVMLLVSCEGPAGRDGLPGKDGDGLFWYVETFTVGTNEWELVQGRPDDFGTYFRKEILLPELDEAIYSEGHVLCYIFDKVDGLEVQSNLPYVKPFGEIVNGKEYFWNETYSYDFIPGNKSKAGSVMIYVKYSDFMTSIRPGTWKFRIVLNY
ncbi:MAG: hypothetical protein LBS79_07920 [Tannerella sp.]|jgi:hypothetical protein|nr:hypothetical protein [Tannerella sp.]